MLIKNASLLDGARVDLRCRGGLISQMASELMPETGEPIFDAEGGALLPGLHDHHIHLFALAAARASVFCGPPSVHSLAELTETLRASRGEGEWVRAVGYHESVAGLLDRWRLDEILARRPLRLQHRGGKMWLLNSAAIECLGLDQGEVGGEGVERDSRGRATGRLFRMDQWLGQRLAREAAPDLTEVSIMLAACGVTGVTDASASNEAAAVESLARAAREGQLSQHVLIMGSEQLPEPVHPQLRRGAVKILLDDHRLPEFDGLLARIERAREQGRSVAIHCVTVTELVFALTALQEVGPGHCDRIEHASVVPDDVLPLMQACGVTAVTQPCFIQQRGDQYLRDVPRSERDLLYRCRGLMVAGIPVGGGSDAPYGDPDPWLSMRAAVERRSLSGHQLGFSESLSPEQALALFTTDARDPGGSPRLVEVGAPADLCVLKHPWPEVRARLDAADVALTLRGGDEIYRDPQRISAL